MVSNHVIKVQKIDYVSSSLIN